MVGSWIGDYYVQKVLGKGGMGEVYLAYDQSLRRHVAIKAVHPELLADPVKAARFKDEAILQCKLQHPNVATVYQWIEQDGRSYIVMEFVQGETLDGLVRRVGVLPLGNALSLFIQALRGFGYAHSQGVVHRDIKPSNLMVDHLGVVKIMDFGIARDQSGERLTQTGKTVGTPEYMSPEQVLGKPVDRRADIYSLGILLYELVTGDLPFNETSPFETMNAQLYTAAPDLAQLRPDVPGPVRDSIAKALAKNPDDRFQKAEEWIAQLEPVAAGLPAVDVSKAEGPVTAVEIDSLSREATSATRRTSTAAGATVLTPAAPMQRWLVPTLIGVVVLAIAAVGISMANRPGTSRGETKGQTQQVPEWDKATAMSDVRAATKAADALQAELDTLRGAGKDQEAKGRAKEFDQIRQQIESTALKVPEDSARYGRYWLGLAEHYSYVQILYGEWNDLLAFESMDRCARSLTQALHLARQANDRVLLSDIYKQVENESKWYYQTGFKNRKLESLDALIRLVKESPDA